MSNYRLDFGNNYIEVEVMGANGTITSNLKEGCEEDPARCPGCAAIDGVESLILALACEGYEINNVPFHNAVQAALDAIGNQVAE